MTNGEALQSFFSSFDIPAYPVTAVPDNATMPYLTYTPIFDFWAGSSSIITVNLWFRTSSEAIPNGKADQIADRIGMGGVIVRTEEGAIWIKRGSPWCQSVEDDDTTVKRRYLNIVAEYLN